MTVKLNNILKYCDLADYASEDSCTEINSKVINALRSIGIDTSVDESLSVKTLEITKVPEFLAHLFDVKLTQTQLDHCNWLIKDAPKFGTYQDPKLSVLVPKIRQYFNGLNEKECAKANLTLEPEPEPEPELDLEGNKLMVDGFTYLDDPRFDYKRKTIQEIEEMIELLTKQDLRDKELEDVCIIDDVNPLLISLTELKKRLCSEKDPINISQKLKEEFEKYKTRFFEKNICDDYVHVSPE